MIRSYSELNGKQIDILCELGNIGAGNAATSLSTILNESVCISTPRAMIINDGGLPCVGCDPEDYGISVTILYTGDICGCLLFFMRIDEAKRLGDLMAGDYENGDNEEELSEMKTSAVMEIGNMLGFAFLGAISKLTGFRFDMSVPAVMIGKASAIMDAQAASFSGVSGKVLLIEEEFLTDQRHLKSHVILSADIPSVNKILDRFFC